MNILVASAGSINGINVIKALKGDVVACDSHDLAAGLYLARKHYIVDGIDDIIKVCKKEKIDIVIPVHSKELPLFAINKSKFDTIGVKMCISSPEIYALTENKIKCNEILKKIVKIPGNRKYPLIIKPIYGAGSRGMRIANNSKELTMNEGEFVQEYVEGKEWTIDGVSDLNGKMICALPRIRLEKTGGLATKAQTHNNKKLVALAKKIAETIGMVGAWNVQCIQKGKEYYFIDVNNRFPSGGTPLDVASGMNTPQIIIDLLAGKKVKPKLVYGKTMVRYYDAIIL